MLLDGVIMIDIKVTRIGKFWHARLFLNGKLYDEMACSNRMDLGKICRIMMRWLDKTGGGNKWTERARRRLNKDDPGFHGEILYRHQIESRKNKTLTKKGT